MPVSVGTINVPSKTSSAISQAFSTEKVFVNSATNVSVLDAVNQKIENNLENFSNNLPKILFVCDYVINNKKVGCLLVFEKYRNATHYEVFKKNKFDNLPKFERILFLDRNSLKDETERFLPYIRDYLGFNFQSEEIIIILDDAVKEDRIYEFFVKAVFIPKEVTDINFLAALKSNDQVKSIEATQKSLFDQFGSTAWVISLLNNEVPFFGLSVKTTNLSNYQKIVFQPKDIQYFMKVIQDSIFLFDTKTVFSYILGLLGAINAQSVKTVGLLNEEISKAFIDAIDEHRGVFSTAFFKDSLFRSSKTFRLFISIFSSETDERKSLLISESLSLPDVNKDISFNSFDGLSDIFDFVKKIDYAITYVASNFENNNNKAGNNSLNG